MSNGSTGPSHAEEISDAPLLARLPIDPELAALGDAGAVEQYARDEAAAPLRVPAPA